MNMLDCEAPGLCRMLQALPAEKRRRALARVALAVSQRIRELEPRAIEILSHAIKENSLPSQMMTEMKAYAEAADEHYFIEKERGTARAIWSNWFAKARLATALLNLFGANSWESAADAGYELCFTSDDKEFSVSVLRSEIDAEFTSS